MSISSLPIGSSLRDFIIGASNWGGSQTYYFAGLIAGMKIGTKILTQADVDIMYSTRYDKTLFPANTLSELSINAKNEVQEWQTDFPMIAQDSNYIYRRGYTPGYGLRSGHQLQIKGGY